MDAARCVLCAVDWLLGKLCRCEDCCCWRSRSTAATAAAVAAIGCRCGVISGSAVLLLLLLWCLVAARRPCEACASWGEQLKERVDAAGVVLLSCLGVSSTRDKQVSRSATEMGEQLQE
jgi:hypothetical protein